MAQDGRQRIDKWLFFARVVKSRSLAAKLAQAGRVRVNREKIDSASYPVKIGDVLTITLERRILVYEIRDTGARRGPAPEAQLLYEDRTPPPPPKEEKPAVAAEREPGAGRPTKRERRQIARFTKEEE